MLLFVVVYVTVHLPAIFYGTHQTPLHVSYWSADEQSPINGALHMLQNKSILGMRNQHTLYYGPVFALLAVPAVVVDYGVHVVTGGSAAADAYKQDLIFDWGSILVFARFTAVLFSLLGLVAVFLLFRTETINPANIWWLPHVVCVLLGSNYLFFEYASFARHWIYLVSILLWQMYLAVLIVEGKRKVDKRILWSAQALLTIASFGISYLSIIYQSFWIPIIYLWFKQRSWSELKQFFAYLAGSLGGFLIVVWWHPYGFFRTFRLLDNAAVSDVGISSVPGDWPLMLIGQSFIFYGQVLIVSAGFLLVCGALYCLAAKGGIFAYLRQWWVYMLLTPACVNAVLFIVNAHNEARYFLPTVALTILLVGGLSSLSISHGTVYRVAAKVGTGFLLLYLVFSLVQIVGWTRMMAAGPVERREIIPQILAWQEENPDARILVSKDWPLGWVHTREAYQDYVARYEKSKYELWQYLIQHEGPEGVPQLNVYYIHEPREELTDELMAEYDHVVRHVWPAVGKDIARESPQDEFDIRPWNVWRYRDFQERYEILK